MSRYRLLAPALLVVTSLGLATGCPGPSENDGGTVVVDAGGDSEGDGTPDAGATDAGEGGSEQDAGVSSEAACGFNDDCPDNERCECDEATGCFCFIGARGTGVLGVDTCDTGNDCESALCLEGPGGTYYCSGECVSDDDCGGAVPLCRDISFVGRICVRDPADA